MNDPIYGGDPPGDPTQASKAPARGRLRLFGRRLGRPAAQPRAERQERFLSSLKNSSFLSPPRVVHLIH